MKRLKIILFFFLLGVVCISFFYLFTDGKGTYKFSESIGTSETIEESINRRVFIKELDYKIIPDTITLVDKKVFFIERRFRYGKYSAKKTLPLRDTDSLKYRIGMDPAAGEVFSAPYLSRGFGYFDVMKDTFKSDIVTAVPYYDSIYKVGELVLFDKK